MSKRSTRKNSATSAGKKTFFFAVSVASPHVYEDDDGSDPSPRTRSLRYMRQFLLKNLRNGTSSVHRPASITNMSIKSMIEYTGNSVKDLAIVKIVTTDESEMAEYLIHVQKDLRNPVNKCVIVFENIDKTNYEDKSDLFTQIDKIGGLQIVHFNKNSFISQGAIGESSALADFNFDDGTRGGRRRRTKKRGIFW